jgi:hypothetical protein
MLRKQTWVGLHRGIVLTAEVHMQVLLKHMKRCTVGPPQVSIAAGHVHNGDTQMSTRPRVAFGCFSKPSMTSA